MITSSYATCISLYIAYSIYIAYIYVFGRLFSYVSHASATLGAVLVAIWSRGPAKMFTTSVSLALAISVNLAELDRNHRHIVYYSILSTYIHIYCIHNKRNNTTYS